MSKKRYNDFNTIDSMVEKNNPSPLNFINPKRYDAITNRIIVFLRSKEKPQTIDDIQKEIQDFTIKDNQDFLKFIVTKCEKMKFDQNSGFFQLKSKYTIKNKEDLKEIIRKSEFGISEDEELLDSYSGIKKDLEQLKQEQSVKVIYNEEKKNNVLLFRDLTDPIEKILIDKNFEDSIEELRKFWKSETLNINRYDDDPNRLGRKRPRKEKERKRFMNKRLVNTHLEILKEFL